MMLTDKAANDRLILVEDFNFTEAKTRHFAAMRRKLPGAGRLTMVLTPDIDRTVMRMSRNIPRVHIDYASRVNVLDLLNHEYILATPKTIEVLTARLVK